jgi:hypothetical protein
VTCNIYRFWAKHLQSGLNRTEIYTKDLANVSRVYAARLNAKGKVLVFRGIRRLKQRQFSILVSFEKIMDPYRNQ